MASTSSATERETPTLEEFGRDVLRRRALLGEVEVPRNAGGNRTSAKRALLDAIDRNGKRW